MDYKNLGDEILIQLIVQGKSEALGELFDRYGRLVYSLAVSAIGERETAEDITQEVFTQVWQNASAYRAEKAKVATWLTSITRYRSIDAWRRRSVRPHHNPESWAEAQELPNHTDLEDMVELNLKRQQIRRAITDLPEEQRQVLALAYFRGYSHREIADALGTPLGTVKTRIRLAMQKLRDKFTEADLPDF